MRSVAIAAVALLAACQPVAPDPRGVARGETLLSVQASGRAENRPDEARFTAGVETVRGDAGAASAANREATERLLAALERAGVAEHDVRTQQLSVNRIDYGPRRGQYQAINQVAVRVRDIAKAGAVIGAATAAGANMVNGPTLGIADPERAALGAYRNAYRAARARAEAYAGAAGMRIARVLAIRDGGTAAPQPYAMHAMAVAPPPVVAEQAAPIRPGLNTAEVAVAVDFALVPR